MDLNTHEFWIFKMTVFLSQLKLYIFWTLKNYRYRERALETEHWKVYIGKFSQISKNKNLTSSNNFILQSCLSPMLSIHSDSAFNLVSETYDIHCTTNISAFRKLYP